MKYYLSAALIVRDAYPDELIEWILWHKFIGIEHFYICDDRSATSVEETLKEYRNIITYINCDHFKIKGKQYSYYNKVLKLARGESRWVAFIDDDEFIFSKINFVDFLKGCEDYKSIEIQWKLFGPNGHLTKPSGIMFNNYKSFRYAKTFKSIANTDKAHEMFNNHCVDVDSQEVVSIGPHGRIIRNPPKVFRQPRWPWGDSSSIAGVVPRWGNNGHEKPITQSHTYIHHYKIRSLEHLMKRVEREKDCPWGGQSLEKYFASIYMHTDHSKTCEFNMKKEMKVTYNKYIEFLDKNIQNYQI